MNDANKSQGNVSNGTIETFPDPTSKSVLNICKIFELFSKKIRLSIVEILNNKRETLYALSEELSITTEETEKELDQLCQHGIITINDDEGRKEYELTEKGKNILMNIKQWAKETLKADS